MTRCSFAEGGLIAAVKGVVEQYRREKEAGQARALRTSQASYDELD
jgi:hypothetical protein